MKINVVEKQENYLFNPDFIRENTITVSFNGGDILRPMEFDLLQMAGKALPYAFAGAAALAYSSGDIGKGLFLSVIPALDVITNSGAIRDSAGRLTSRFQDMHPDEVKNREINTAEKSKEDRQIDSYQGEAMHRLTSKNTLVVTP